MSPKDFQGVSFKHPDGDFRIPNSVFYALERRYVADKEAIQSLARQKVLARESGKKGVPVKRKNTEKFHRALCREFVAWTAKRRYHRSRCAAPRGGQCNCTSDSRKVAEFGRGIHARLPRGLRFFAKRLPIGDKQLKNILHSVLRAK